MIVSLMLIAAVMASLALGVLLAYGMCLMMFRIFRFHAISVSMQHAGTRVVRAVVKG